MSIELEKRLLVDHEAVLHAGSWAGEPARIWMIDPSGAGPAAVEGALRDLETLASVEEESLLGIQSSGTLDDGRIWAAVVPTPDIGLHELLATIGPLQLPQLRTLARSLCSGLAALHQHGVLHGGISPALMRYGSASDDETPPRLTGAGWASLRRAWLARSEIPTEYLCRLAPELLTSAVSTADRYSDIFAAGCLLYEAATGAPAFAGATRAEVEQALTSADRPDIRDVLGPAEEPLAKVLRRCLAVASGDRYPSVTALWRELAPALGSGAEPLRAAHTGPIGLPADAKDAAKTADEARPAARGDSDRPRKKGGSGLVTLGITLGALALAAVILFLWRAGHIPGSESPKPDPAAGQTPDPAATMDAMAGARRPSMRRRTVGVPPPVRPRAGAARLDRLLARVGLTGGEVEIDHSLATDYDLAVQALHDGKPAAFAEAERQIERATRPKLCASFLKKKLFYIKSGIRTLGKRLQRWQRFRIERSLADINHSRGGCRARSRRLSPLVEEVRDRLLDRKSK